ncbi:hypothetical protein [Bacillus sp. JJ1773]|uniref:hypothetical protein n=1 Tax=Bacillus sp. JJ1773 TaxID=3122965 RepID=UPI002FFE3213
MQDHTPSHILSLPKNFFHILLIYLIGNYIVSLFRLFLIFPPLVPVLDIIIILLWARHENKKRAAAEQAQISRKKRIHSPRFWKLLSMGMLEIINDRIRIHWINTSIVVILMLILKFALTKTII